MPPRNDELPEGTDHIINGAMETGGGGDEGGAGGGATGGGGASSGFIGASAGSADATGGTTTGGGTNMATGSDQSGAGGAAALEPTGTGGTSGGGAAGGGSPTEQLRGQVYALRDQAGEKVRGFADTGKTRASDMLEELSRVVADTADSIDERLGNNYGEYARKAADSVSGLAGSLREKDVDELYTNVSDAVRKSPGVAIGIAAVVGFTLARLVKSGMEGGGAGDGTGGGTKSGGGRSGA